MTAKGAKYELLGALGVLGGVKCVGIDSDRLCNRASRNLQHDPHDAAPLTEGFDGSRLAVAKDSSCRARAFERSIGERRGKEGRRMTLARSFAAGVSVTALLIGGAAIGAPRSENPGTPFEMLMDQHLQIQEKVEEIPGYIAIWVPETVEKVEFKVRLPKLQARVDPTACAAGFPACGLDQEGPATDQNDQPIRMFLLVARDGVGVEGLTAEAFGFDNAFFPAGGPKAVPCESNCGAMWFYEGGSGLYAMFLEPMDGNWRAGRYAAAVKVKLGVTDPYLGDAEGTTLVTFEIPSAPPPID